MIPEYEHLDVIWAMDAENEVFREVREVLWRTASEKDRARCRVPKGCEEVERWVDDRQGKEEENGVELEDQEAMADATSDYDEDEEDENAALLSSSGLSRSSSTSGFGSS